MKMKKLFKFFSMMVLIMMGQNAWAADVYTRDLLWTQDTLSAKDIVSQGGKTQMVRMNYDGLQITMVSDSNIAHMYEPAIGWDGWGAGWKPRRFTLGSVGAATDADSVLNGAISWNVPDGSFRVVVYSVTTTSKVGGNQCNYTLGEAGPIEVDFEDGKATIFKTMDELTCNTIGAADVYVPFKFYAGPERTRTTGRGEQAAIQSIGMTYAVYPTAPVWDGDSMLITVDSTNIHWYKMADHFTVADAFKGTLKFDVKVTRGDEKYMFWNEDNSAFYMLKKMDFEIKAWVDPYQGKWDSYEYEYVGGYNASEVTTQVITSVHRTSEPAMIFFYDGDRWIREKDEQGYNYASYLVSVPVEHFVGYVCVYEDKMEYLRKDSAYVSYVEGVRDRRDYFNMRGESGSDYITVKIGAAESTLRIKAEGSEPNRVPFIIDTEAKYDSLKHSAENVVWNRVWTDAGEKDTLKVRDVVRFQGDFNMFTKRYYKIHFVGVPDSLFYEYGNAAKGSNGTFTVEWSADGSSWKTLRTREGKHAPSENQQFYDSIQLDKTARWLRFKYTNAQNAAYVKNIKVTEFKRLYANPEDSLIRFDTVTRAPGQHLTEYATLAWANLAPELRFDAKDPFSVKSRIKVRLEQIDTTFANNKFAVLESRDSAGVFYQRMKISSMDFTQPMATYVTINGVVTFDTLDMFAAFKDLAYNVKYDTIQYGDTAFLTIKDSLNTILKHDSLIVTYTMDGDTVVGDSLIGACVGAHTIVATAQRNTLVRGDWADTLYIYVREREADSLTFNVPAEIGMKDTLPADFVVALDSVATLSYEFDKPAYFEVTTEGRLVALKNDKADSVWVKVAASETCEHFAYTDSIRVWVRRVVTTEFNDSVEWMTNVFGNDTLYNPLFVKNDDKTAFENTDSLTIAFEYTPDSVVVDTVVGQWYLRRSTEPDSLFVKVTVSGDSIKTVKDSIKFPVREYIAEITWPGTIDDRGYYFVGDTLKVADFIATATNPERAGKDLTNLVNWTKTFVEAADGTVLEDGSVLLDSVNTSVLQVCLDTLFVKDTCAYDTLIVKPAIVKDLFFPGVDSIYVVGDSIAVRDIVVKDTADRDISRYVRYNFAYIPEDFAHNTADSLNMFIKDTFTDYIVLDKNGLDTAAVDTVVSRTQGGLVTEKEFKDRLLIAPVYAVNVVWADTVFTVGDTVRTSMLTAIDGKGNDVTRYSSFIFVAADSVAERINDSTIVMKKAGKVMVKVVAKRNESMHQGKFTQMLTVNPIQAKSVEGIADSYKVFDVLDTKTLVFRDTADNVIPAKYIAVTYTFDEAVASQNGDNITFNHVTDGMSITANLTGNVVGTPSVDVTVYPYDQAVIVYDATAFVVGDEVNFNLFSVETADGKEIADSYYTFAYDVIDKKDARIMDDSTSMIIDSLAAELQITMTSADIAAQPNPATFVIEAAKLDAERIEFPEGFYVGQGFGINEIKVFTANNKDITEYAVNQLAFKFDDEEARMSADGDSIYFKQAGKIVINTTVGDLLINEKQFSYKMYVDQIQVDSILFPAIDFIVDDTISASMLRVFENGVEVTELVHDIRLSMKAQEGEKMADGRYVFIKKDSVSVTAEVRGISGSKPFEKTFTYVVAPIEGDRFVLPATEFKVLDQIEINKIKYYQGEKEITKYVKNAMVTMPLDSATNNGLYITLDRAGQMTVTAELRGNAKGTVKQVITVDEYVNATIVLDQINFVLGDTLTADMFHLEDAQGNVLTPRYGEFVLDIEAGYGRVENNAIIFDKPGAPMINATFESEVKADPLDQTCSVDRTKATKIEFQKTNYTVGDTAWVKDLKILDAQGRDITRFAQNGFKHITFDPYLAGETSVEEGYIAFNRPGTIQIKSGIQNDSVYYSDLSNTLFVDYLVANRIELPQKNYIVGDEMKKSDIRVYAGDREISAFADVTFVIDEEHGLGHYTANGFVFDSVANVKVQVLVSGVGVKVMDKDSVYSVSPVSAKKVNLPTEAVALDMINIKNLIFTDSIGRNINQYINKVEYSFEPMNYARLKGDYIIFDSIGTVTITSVVSGNAVGELQNEINVSALKNVNIVWNKTEYHVGDMAKPSDFAVLDMDGKLIPADYQVTISCDAKYGHPQGENIVLDTVGYAPITVTVNGQVVAQSTIDCGVWAATAAYVQYPKNVKVLDEIAIADLKVYTANGTDITTYVYNEEKGRNAYEEFIFIPADAASYADGVITLNKPGKLAITTVLAETQLVYGAKLETILAVEQLKADSVVFPENAVVGDTIILSKVQVLNEAGEDITAMCGALDYHFDAQDAHFNAEGNIVLDRAAEIKVIVKIQGQELFAYQEFEKTVDVAAVAVKDVVLFDTDYKVLDAVNTAEAEVISMKGAVINQYVEKVNYSFDDNSKAHMEGNNIVFDKAGRVTIYITVEGANIAEMTAPIVKIVNVTGYEGATVLYPTKQYYVGDQLTPADFKVLDAQGKDITKYATITLPEGENNVITLEAVPSVNVKVTVSGNVAAIDTTEAVKVAQCISANLIFPEKDYVLGDTISVDSIIVLDKNGKDITKYAEYEFAGSNFEYVAAENIIILTKSGKVTVTTKVGGELMANAQYTEILSVGQLTAASVEYPMTYNVLDTLYLNTIVVKDAEGNDITKYADVAFYVEKGYGYYTNGNFVFEKSGRPQVNVIVKGLQDVANAKFTDNVTVNAITVWSSDLTITANVFDVIDTKSIRYYDADGKEVTKYIDKVTYQFDNNVARLVGDNIVFENPGTVQVTATATGGAEGTVYTTINVAAYSNASIVLDDPDRSYVIGEKITPADFRVLVDGKVFADAVDAISCDPQYGTPDAQGNILFDKSIGQVGITATIGGQVAKTEVLYVNVDKCVANDVVYPSKNFVVSDTINVADLIVYDAVNNNITDYAQYLSFQFAPATAAQLINNDTQIVLLEAGQLKVTTEVGGDQMDQRFLVDYLGVSKADADNVVLPDAQYVVGEALDITKVTVDGMGGRDLTQFADLSYSFDANDAHFDESGNIVFDREGQITITATIIGAKGVVAESFELKQEVAPCTKDQVILPAGPYVVGGSIDMSKVQIIGTNGKDITRYANVQYTFDETMAHWDGTNLVFDQDGQLQITIDEYGTKTNLYQDIQTITVVKMTAADVNYPTNVFYVGDVVPQSAFTVVDAQGKDITAYATLNFNFAATDAHFDDNGDIVVDVANFQLPIQVVVSGLVNDFTVNKTIAVAECIPAAVLFPNLADTADYQVGDSIDINSLVIVDANRKDITIYGQYQNFVFDPQGSAHIDNNYIIIDKAGRVKIFITVANPGKMAQGTFVVRLGVDQANVTTAQFQSYNYIVGDTIDLSTITVLDKNNVDMTKYADLAFSCAEADGHLTADGNIVLDKAGQITINVEVIGREGIAQTTLPTILTVAPCTAASFVLPAGPYVVSESLDLSKPNVTVISDLGRDITRYAELTFTPDAPSYMSGDVLYFEKSGQLNIGIALKGPDAVGNGNVQINVDKCVADQVIFPAVPQGGYYVENTIDTKQIVVLDANGKDITRYAELNFSFMPEDAAHMDGDNIVLDKYGMVAVTVAVSGEVQDKQFIENIEVIAFEITRIIFPEGPYYVNEALDSLQVLAGDLVLYPHYVQVNYDYTEGEIEIVDGQIVPKVPGYVSVTVKVTGNGIIDSTFTKVLYVRADDTDCYDLMTLVWDDLILIDNDNEDLPQFVSYKWYKDEIEIANQATQDYYVRAEDKDGEEHIYYARAYDAQGNEYKICEKVFMFEAPVAVRRTFNVYPTMMTTADQYTVETSVPGRVSISNINGAPMDQYGVEEGKNSAKAPMATGVYILRYEAVDGSINTQKLIVK